MINVLAGFPKGIKTGSIVLTITFLMWFLADSLYGSLVGEIVRTRMMLLVVSFVLSVILTGKKFNETTINLQNIGLASLIFAGTFLLALFLQTVVGQATLASTEPLTIITVASVVIPGGFLLLAILAFYEELIFRGQLLPRYGATISSVFFGILHAGVIIVQNSALSIVTDPLTLIAPITVLIFLGFLWSWMTQRFGIMAAVGSHIAWNLAVSGVF